MGQDKHFTACLIRLLLLFGLAVGLSACALRPKPLDPTRPYTVTGVQVTAESIEDFGFADRLRQKLEATAGRATSDIGQSSELRIVIFDRRAETGLIGFFDRSIKSASLNLVLINAGTGQVMRSGALRASSVGGHGYNGETVLIGRLADDVRAMLGLSGYAPHPVSGAKRAVVHPLGRPENLTGIELLSADPLLNGTVTPTTADLDLEPDAAPTLDISKPLLSAVPAAGEPEAVRAAVIVPQALEPAATDAAAEPSPGEPCIITLDNECGDPDGQ